MRRILLAIVLIIGLAVSAWADFQAGFDAYKRGDYATALKEWRPLAEAGNAEAQHSLGVMYNMGQGVPQDYAKAMKWFRKAADQGVAHAQHNLGIFYFIGRGVPKDYAAAARWFRKAAAQGLDIAKKALARVGAKGAKARAGRDFLGVELDESSWKLINKHSTNEFGVMEYVPTGEDPRNWTRLIFVGFNALSRIDAPERQDKFKSLKDFFEKHCPGGVTWNVVSNDENGLLYERFSKPCRGHPQEHTIGRILDGKYDRWELYYSERVARILPNERLKWIYWLSTATLKTVE